MGRCYEFGVEIHPGCENTMVVSAQGGACECADCGARCPGRFSGCAAVVAVPGRIPLSAPAWSRPGAERPVADVGTTATPNGSSATGPSRSNSSVATDGQHEDGPSMASLQEGLDEVRALIVALSRHVAGGGGTPKRGSATKALEDLVAHLQERDERMAAALVEVDRHQAELSAQVERLAAAVAGMDKGVTLQDSLRQIMGRRP